MISCWAHKVVCVRVCARVCACGLFSGGRRFSMAASAPVPHLVQAVSTITTDPVLRLMSTCRVSVLACACVWRCDDRGITPVSSLSLSYMIA